MTELGELVSGDLDEWLDVLPGYQRARLQSMLVTRDPLEVATAWLDASGPMDTAPFGATKSTGERFFDNLLNEMKKLFCGDATYESELKELLSAGNGTKMFLVAGISTVLAPHVGAAAAVIAPAVTLVLAVAGKAGAATACGSLTDIIEARSSTS